MSVDYNAISDGILAWLEDLPDLAATVLRTEPDLEDETFLEGGPYIDIAFEERVATPDKQRISAGKRYNLELVYSIWVTAFHPGEKSYAARERNRLITLIETRLMEDPSLGGLCEQSWQEGGVMADLRREDRWGSAGQIRLILNVRQVI